jgi:hypothetical protein
LSQGGQLAYILRNIPRIPRQTTEARGSAAYRTPENPENIF